MPRTSNMTTEQLVEFLDLGVIKLDIWNDRIGSCKYQRGNRSTRAAGENKEKFVCGIVNGQPKNLERRHGQCDPDRT